MKADKGMTCGFEENIRRILTDAERKMIVDPKADSRSEREADACEEHSEGNDDWLKILWG